MTPSATTELGVGPPPMAPPLPGVVTIDATPNLNYLAFARAGTPNTFPNTSIETAVSGLLKGLASRPNPTTATIIGCGAEGCIATGAGQNLGSTDQYVSLTNEAIWAPIFAALKGRITDLYLYGCSVGAGEDGALLLYRLAQATNANVWGPAGVIYCNSQGDFYLQEGAQWQCSTPACQPRPIDPLPPPEPPQLEAVALGILSAG